MRSLYVHIPFCNRICTYCDFNKVLIKNQPVDAYLMALKQEIDSFPVTDLKTIYVGGGTPTSLSMKQLEFLLQTIKNKFGQVSEYTFEANPDELTTEKISLLKDYDVNRISLGVQTFNNDLLKVLGRTHNFDDIYRSIEHMNKIGLDNYSIDLMYNLPGEKLMDIEDSLKNIEILKPKHISWYSLIIEPHTVFYNKINRGQMSIGSSIKEGEIYGRVINGLNDIGYPQYEISNFSQKEFQSQHNKTYWLNENYLAAGAGSHGYIGDMRYYNIKPVTHYIKSMNDHKNVVKEKIKLNKTDMMEEEMFLRLRLNQGVSIERFEDKFNMPIYDVYGKALDKHINLGHLQQNDHYISLTDEGRMIGNDIFVDFLIDD
ncbi:radical SAM family heme chaperone HemW [Phocicoccus pinnipedialis]|uniref:Heme chaperone HemW n=1 Tax=Phocicoccus pinnipedialis TaxID=110845 RepID=A0A6V7RG23_9BACL|nr:radical SAM family heme chaperone HemW [Jeotgalicoccus pinnipedialis]MBP1939252.1 oxygen-independent coproporphyrinogen-3 oxidase [Jeotgalicoccus pinnipedialis]CAD2076135.1 Oxygen-independent coproporphyrinogen-III oxidase 1 [Jeotgalicoccus pinnipedialis]